MEQTKQNAVAKNLTTAQKNTIVTQKPEETATTQKPAEHPAITAPLYSEKPGEKDQLPPFEDRMQRLSQLFEMQGKYEKLKQSDEKLKDFTIKGNEGAELHLEDSEGNDFVTKNAEIVADVVKFLKQKIAEKRKALEAQIRW
jgi:hypothetical protein